MIAAMLLFMAALLLQADSGGAVVSSPKVEPDPIPTWNGDIAPLLSRRCAACHQPGGVGPFDLLTYQDVSRRARFIVSVVEAGLMPPWLPGDDGLPLRHVRRLSSDEKQMLSTWAENGMPIGDGVSDMVKVPPPPVMRADLSRETILPYELPEETPVAYHLGEMDKHSFRLLMANGDPLRIQAIRGASNAPQSVRVMTLVTDTEGKARYLDHEDPLPGWRTHSDLAYKPSGAEGVLLMGGEGLRLPRGFHWAYPPRTEVALGLHFKPTGRKEVLKEVVEFELVPDGEQSRPLRWLPSVVIHVDVMAGDKARIKAKPTVVPVDVDLVAITPRATDICTSSNLHAVLPDGRRVLLMEIADWDHHRRETHVLEKPLRLPAGTRIEGAWELDNTDGNPRNPDDPPIDVDRRRRTGMLLTLLHVAAVSENDDSRLMEFGTETIGLRQRP